MDGNRRWAMQRDLPVAIGHIKGAETLLAITEAAIDLGIGVLTVYAFSTENWRRTPDECRNIFQIMEQYLQRECPRMVSEGVRLRTIGSIERLPEELRSALARTMQATAQGQRIDLVLALNYGGRDEIVRAVRKAAKRVQQGELSLDDLDEKCFASMLDTAEWPDPELIIRTSGEVRLSNFLLWQAGYAEVVPMEVLWPDFSRNHLMEAIATYQQRSRRHGV